MYSSCSSVNSLTERPINPWAFQIDFFFSFSLERRRRGWERTQQLHDILHDKRIVYEHLALMASIILSWNSPNALELEYKTSLRSLPIRVAFWLACKLWQLDIWREFEHITVTKNAVAHQAPLSLSFSIDIFLTSIRTTHMVFFSSFFSSRLLPSNSYNTARIVLLVVFAISELRMQSRTSVGADRVYMNGITILREGEGGQNMCVCECVLAYQFVFPLKINE